MNQIYRNKIVLKYLFTKALPYAQYSKFKVLWYAFEWKKKKGVSKLTTQSL